MTKYTPECAKLQQFKKNYRGSMLALALGITLHRGLEVKESNSSLAFGQSKLVWDLVRSNMNFSKWRITLKVSKTVRKGECPEDV